MRPWDVGGCYSRTIPRGIVEEAGVPRELFGVRKSYISQWFVTSSAFLSTAGRKQYEEWISRHRVEWLKKGRIPTVRNAQWDRARQRALLAASRKVGRVPGICRDGIRNLGPVASFLCARDWRDGVPPLPGLRRYLFPWTIHQTMNAYRYSAGKDTAPEVTQRREASASAPG